MHLKTLRLRSLAFLSVFVLGTAGFLTTARAEGPASLAELEKGFASPPMEARPMMRWWWFGPAVTHQELSRELTAMKDLGLGGAEIQSVYPLSPDDETTGLHNLVYGSPEFLEALTFASEKARDLGLRADLTLGSGWPFGGPQIPADLAASKLRFVKVQASSRRVALPAIQAGEKLLAVFGSDRAKQFTDIRDGVVWLPENEATPTEVLVFISSRTGQMVKRAAVGAEGFVLDHYDRAAIDRFLAKVDDPMIKAFGKHPPYAVFCDSLEVFASDWTGHLLDEFRKRRGYDLVPHLPALVEERGPESAAVRHDVSQTLTTLFEENFAQRIQSWAQSHQTKFRLQAYGIPPATVSSAAFADLNEGEGWHWKTMTSTRWASSASHIYNRPVTSSETWTWIHSPVFRATPLDLKAEADLHFLQGINQLIGHGWPYSAPEAVYPGWRFYASGALNDHNPWSIVMPDLFRYLGRVSYLLRAGQPVNDIAVYLPNDDTWATLGQENMNLFKTMSLSLGKKLTGSLLQAGYNFDFFDDTLLKQLGRSEQGQFSLGGGHYKAVIIPAVKSMPLQTLQTLEKMAQAGVVVVALKELPTLAPGFLATAHDDQEISQRAHALFQGPAAPGHFVADENEVGTALAAWVPADLTLAAPNSEIGYVHRSTSFGEIYFIANTSNQPLHTEASFHGRELTSTWWNPLTGTKAGVNASQKESDKFTVPLDLEPYGSNVLILTKGGKMTPQPAMKKTLSTMALNDDWQVVYGPTGKPTPMATLRSWTDSEDTRYFSGVATYKKTVSLAGDFFREGVQVELDLGTGKPLVAAGSEKSQQVDLDTSNIFKTDFEAPVREAAIVSINGKRAGSVWSPPYRIDVTGLLHAGENQIEIEVANLAVNSMAGHALPDYTLLNLRYGVRFEAQHLQNLRAEPAGLLGPIQLIAKGP